ncbi:MAG: Abortive infection protein AbiEii [Lachnospiraceae bacterium]|nr:Abortive infection protein AbiEii [Lachnospiraceae bacterium]
MISAISVKDRLKNRTVANGKKFQDMLMAYGLERTTIYRLSLSGFKERFTLKGGIFLYTLFEFLQSHKRY